MTREEAEVILKANTEDAKKKFEGLENKAKDLKKQFEEAFKKGDTQGILKINQELQKTNRQMDSMRTNAANIRAAMVRLDEASPRDLQKTIKYINSELNSGRVKRGSEEWKYYIARLKETQAELKKVKAEMALADDRGLMTKIKDGFNQWAAAGAAAIAAFAGVVMSGKSAVQAYADMEAEEANVRKFTGMTADEVARLNQEFKKMDTRTSRENLNKLAQEAGRLGKTSVEEVMGFVKAADKINVALNELGEGATLTLSKLTGIFGDEKIYGTEKSLLKVGSVINELSQNCSASAPYLAEFSSRLGGIAAQSKMTISQTMAFAAVLDTQNLAVEASATAVGQLITKIYKEPAKFAKVTGLEVKKFTDMVKTDMNGALIMLFEHLNKFGGMETLAKVFDDMGTDGARAVPVLSALAGHVEELKEQQQAANQAFREGISVTNEFNVQNNTVQARIDKAKKKFTEIAVTLGEKLLPVMQHCISGSSMMLRVLSVIVDFIGENRKAIIGLSAALITYNAIVKSSTIALKAQATWMVFSQKVSDLWKNSLAALRVVLTSFTMGLRQAKIAYQELTAAQSLTIWGAVAAAVGLAVNAIVNYATKTDKVAEASNRLKETLSDTQKEIRNERKEIDTLFGKLDAARKGTKEYEDAKTAIINQYGQYLSGLSQEVQSLEDVAAAYRAITEEATNSAKARGLVAATQKADDAFNDTVGLESKNIYDALSDAEQIIKRGNSTIKKKLTEREITRWQQKILEAASSGGEFSSDVIQFLQSIGVWKTKSGDFNGRSAGSDVADAINSIVKAARTHEFERSQAEITFGNPNTTYAGMSYEDLNRAIYDINKLLETSSSGVVKLANGKTINYDDRAEWLNEIKQLEKLIEKNLNSQDGVVAVGAQPKPSVILPESDDDRKKREEKERKALKDALDNAKYLRDKADADNLKLYAAGGKNYVDYIAEKERIDQNYADEVVKIHEDHNTIDIAAYGAALLKREELKKKSVERQRKQSLEELDDKYSEDQREAIEDFYNPNGILFNNQKALNQRLFELDVEYLKEKAELYEKGSKERVRLEKEADDRIYKDQLDKQKELAETYKQFKNDTSKDSERERMTYDLSMLKELLNAKLISEEEYEKAVLKIKKKYSSELYGQALGMLDQSITSALSKLGDAGKRLEKNWKERLDGMSEDDKERFNKAMDGNPFFKIFNEGIDAAGTFYDTLANLSNISLEDLLSNIAELAENSAAIIGTINQTFSQYWAAQRDVEISQIEKRYQTEIDAAKNNSKKVAKLEAQKEAEIAKVKTRYNDRAMRMEIAMATAQTAVAAINAYASASKVNWVLGPIAAAMAVAAGAVQIATIKKQHEAEAAGYYSGGFTSKDPDNRREVGVVHANEFVANHKAVANPSLSPLFRLIDHAQRNNTVGTLTAEDVDIALGHRTGVSARGGSADTTGNSSDVFVMAADSISRSYAATKKAVDRLSEVLENGVEAKMIMDGEDGFHRKYEHFKRLSENPKR